MAELKKNSIGIQYGMIDTSHVNLGILLAVSSSLFIGSSFIIKKMSLIRLNQTGNLRAGAGGFGYLKDWIWWLGVLTMGMGELANFAAYTFAPASLVTPLGALSVLVSAILATRFLNERLNTLGKLGCLLCILGSTIIIIHSPKEERVDTFDDLVSKMQEPSFINYVIIILVISIIILCYVGPRYGSRYVVVYVTLCSAVGSITVMACKGIGLAIKSGILFSEKNTNTIWIAYCLFFLLVSCVCIQLNYLNKALDIYSTSIVTPIYYVFFTTLVIIESTILFREWENMRGEDVLGAICGFLVVTVAIFILHKYKENNSFKQIIKSYGSTSYVPVNLSETL